MKNLQNYLDNIVKWEKINNMKFNLGPISDYEVREKKQVLKKIQSISPLKCRM